MNKVKIYFACHQHCETFITVSQKLSLVFEENIVWLSQWLRALDEKDLKIRTEKCKETCRIWRQSLYKE